MTETGTKTQNPLILDKYEDSSWKELPVWVREAATALGYTKKLWNRDEEPDVCGADWKDLKHSQRKAAEKLGYNQETWDGESDSSSSSSSSNSDSEDDEPETKSAQFMRLCPNLRDVHKHFKWTIYCIQLYTETPDYQFRVTDDTGLCMHANRALEAEEAIVQSPVGPQSYKELFEIDESGVVSEERKGFAQRFLEWQETYQAINRVGAQNGNVIVKLEDFFNPPITSKKYRPMPSEKSLVYDLEIFEHEVVIVEFIPPPSNPNYQLPAARRFEILHYAEGLVGLDGEKGYDPSVMKRPPTLCGMEERSLELPGHFHNHASGETSTAFEFLRGDRYTDFPLGHGDDLPEWLSKEMDAFKRFNDGDERAADLLVTRRALEPGTEITTDYSRWHWSNGDYYVGASRKTPIGFFLGDVNTDRWLWDELSPKIQRAARILGFNQALWDSGASTSTFQKSWKNLSLQEKEAAINLTGHNEKSWNNDKGFDDESESPSLVGALDELEWAALSQEQKKAAAILGHNETTWNEGDHESFMRSDLYWYNFRPEHRDALVALGETEATWEEDVDEESAPWFYCLCGDANCHSSKQRGGFRGVEHFPVEEQRKLAPFCEPWVQQSIAWRIYELEKKGGCTSSRKRKNNIEKEGSCCGP